MIAATVRSAPPPTARNRRTRASIHVVMDGLRVQWMPAPEFRLQCIREGVEKIDLFILTHGHATTSPGMDDLRRFCDMLGGRPSGSIRPTREFPRFLSVYPYAIMERAVVARLSGIQSHGMPEVLELPASRSNRRSSHGGGNTLGLVFTEKSTGKRFAYYNRLQAPAARGGSIWPGS